MADGRVPFVHIIVEHNRPSLKLKSKESYSAQKRARPFPVESLPSLLMVTLSRVLNICCSPWSQAKGATNVFVFKWRKHLWAVVAASQSGT